jgi:hypothetical protein
LVVVVVVVGFKSDARAWRTRHGDETPSPDSTFTCTPKMKFILMKTSSTYSIAVAVAAVAAIAHTQRIRSIHMQERERENISRGRKVGRNSREKRKGGSEPI